MPSDLGQSDLGKKIPYDPHYNKDKLFPILRSQLREDLGIHSSASLPFFGYDRFNHYEVSWLNEKGKPIAASAEIIYPATSPYLLESKSLKLYFHSFNNTVFKEVRTLEEIVATDLSLCLETEVNVKIMPSSEWHTPSIMAQFEEAICLDFLDVICSIYTLDPSTLRTEDPDVSETLYSDLLKSNCPVTGQPDWGSICIRYTGQKIEHAGLLQYIVSYRNHNGFHEQCAEQIFIDLMRFCHPKTLTVDLRYTRRGGIDINPYRSTDPTWTLPQTRLYRQ